jgi:hypothetical protein
MVVTWDGFSRRKVMGQRSPSTAGFKLVEDSVEDLTNRVLDLGDIPSPPYR